MFYQQSHFHQKLLLLKKSVNLMRDLTNHALTVESLSGGRDVEALKTIAPKVESTYSAVHRLLTKIQAAERAGYTADISLLVPDLSALEEGLDSMRLMSGLTLANLRDNYQPTYSMVALREIHASAYQHHNVPKDILDNLAVAA